MSNPSDEKSLERSLEASIAAREERKEQEKKLTLLLIAASLLQLSDQGGKGMPEGHLYAFLQCDPYNINLEKFQQLTGVMKASGLIDIKNHFVTLTPKGEKVKGESIMSTTSKKAAAPKPTASDKLKEQLVETIAQFPASFKLKDHKGLCMIAPSKSSIDPETGEETLAIVDKKGELVTEFTGAQLKEQLVELGGSKGKGAKKAKKTASSDKETHVDRMRRLVLAGKTDEEIFKEFKHVFSSEHRRGDHPNSTDDGDVKRRIYLYTWRTADRFEDVKKILEKRRDEKKAAREAEEAAAAKAKKEAKSKAAEEKKAAAAAKAEKASKKEEGTAKAGKSKKKAGKASKKAKAKEASAPAASE